eukprot:scaffold110_cov315-Pavlova_lutheri.AAC.51
MAKRRVAHGVGHARMSHRHVLRPPPFSSFPPSPFPPPPISMRPGALPEPDEDSSAPPRPRNPSSATSVFGPFGAARDGDVRPFRTRACEEV